MLKLSKLADYGVVLLATLARQEPEMLTASQLSTLTNLPAPTSAKILKKMSRAALVKAARGATGGYRLARPAAEINVMQIIEAVDGPLAVTSCAGNIKIPCNYKINCPVHGRWEPINVAVHQAFSSVTLADMINSENASLKGAAA